MSLARHTLYFASYFLERLFRYATYSADRWQLKCETSVKTSIYFTLFIIVFPRKYTNWAGATFVAHEMHCYALSVRLTQCRRASSPHVISCQFRPYNPLNGTPGEIRTHTILILSQTPHASWATGAYGWVCATTLALLGCPPTPYSHFVWDATKVLSLPLSKILDFYQAPRSLPDYYCLTPPIVLAAVFSTAEIYIG